MKIILCLIILSSSISFTQQINNPEWKNYLNSENVQAIAEESNYIWIGSEAGITRLNKITFEKSFYNKGNTVLPTNLIFDIKIDQNGFKWLATYRGLVKFKNDDYVVYDTSNSNLPKNDVRAIEIDSLGNVWVGTYGGGVAKFDGGAWEIFNSSNSNLPSNIINDLEFESSNILWIGTQEGLVKKHGNDFTIYNISNSGLTVNNVCVIKLDKIKNKWIGTARDGYMNNSGGVFKFDGNSWINYLPTRPGFYYNAIYSISIDPYNNKWIAANYYDPPRGGGIFLIDSTDTAIQSLNISLPRYWVNEIYVDKYNVKWIGMDRGFAKYDTSAQVIGVSNSNLGKNEIQGLKVDKFTNKKYFYTYGVSVLSVVDPPFFSVLSDTSWSLYHGNNSPIGFRVSSISPGNNGEVYVAIDRDIWGVLYKFDGSNWKQIQFPNSGYDYVRYIFWDGEKLWACINWDRIFINYNNSWTELTGFPGRVVNQIIKTNSSFWFACGNGLVKYENNSLTIFNTSNSGLPNNSVTSLTVDFQNNLWIGTAGGLAKFDGVNWTIFNSVNSPLIYDNITSLVHDYGGKLYIGTTKGLFRKDSANWRFFNCTNSGLPDVFSSLYGVYYEYCSINALDVDTLNNIWIATSGGVGVYDEDGIPVPVELSSFNALFEGNSVLLNWITSTELNNQGFEIQKKNSESYFRTIGFVKGSGTKSTPTAYSFLDKNIESGKYFYRLKQVDYNGRCEYSNEVEVNITPAKFELEQNYPNPFNPATKIRYTIPALTPSLSQRERVIIRVYDVLGNEVITLVDEFKSAGSYEVEFSAKGGLASGIYFYQMRVNDFVSTKKMILVR